MPAEPRILRLIARHPVALEDVPVPVHASARPGVPTVRIDERWDAPDADLLSFDRQVHAAEDRRADFDLEVDTAHPHEVVLRFQRLLATRNPASSDDRFDEALRRHRALHDTSRPLVRADLDHARDTWQWVLRLDPDASAAVQLAALLHDVERLERETVVRLEHLAPDYDRFKEAHARRGAALASALLAGVYPPPAVARVAALVEAHERARDDADGALLADADALSFFGLNAAGYLAWFGPEITRRKVAWTLRRTTPRARAWLGRLRLPPLVRDVVDGGAPVAAASLVPA